jgi:hypothetical protein
MRNINRFFTSLVPWIASRQESRMRPRHWILGLSLLAALLSFGCPSNDPLQAFNNPEPVTALLFGTALLIGGAIVRRRRNGSKR